MQRIMALYSVFATTSRGLRDLSVRQKAPTRVWVLRVVIHTTLNARLPVSYAPLSRRFAKGGLRTTRVQSKLLDEDGKVVTFLVAQAGAAREASCLTVLTVVSRQLNRTMKPPAQLPT